MFSAVVAANDDTAEADDFVRQIVVYCIRPRCPKIRLASAMYST